MFEQNVKDVVAGWCVLCTTNNNNKTLKKKNNMKTMHSKRMRMFNKMIQPM